MTVQSNPQSAPAMVPLQVVLAGGTGMSFDDACEAIFQEFDPPIKCGTYSKVSSDRRATNKENPSSKYKNHQSEHMVSNSSLQGDRGVNASNVPGAEGYSEGTGFAYSAYDDQSPGTEHKFLTDAARDFDQAAQGFPTVGERIQAAKDWCKDMLLGDLERVKGGEKRQRIKDAKNRSDKEKKELAEAASECLAKKAQQQFEKQGISMDTPTRRGMAGGPSPTPGISGAPSADI